LDRPSLKRQAERGIPTVEEVRKLIASPAPWRDHRLYVINLLAASTGARIVGVDSDVARRKCEYRAPAGIFLKIEDVLTAIAKKYSWVILLITETTALALKWKTILSAVTRLPLFRSTFSALSAVDGDICPYGWATVVVLSKVTAVCANNLLFGVAPISLNPEHDIEAQQPRAGAYLNAIVDVQFHDVRKADRDRSEQDIRPNLGVKTDLCPAVGA
jgi:hypothetical protein